jgi:hypothetical protein
MVVLSLRPPASLQYNLPVDEEGSGLMEYPEPT